MLTWWISRNKPPNLILTQSLHLKYTCGKRAMYNSSSVFTLFHSVIFNSVWKTNKNWKTWDKFSLKGLDVKVFPTKAWNSDFRFFNSVRLFYEQSLPILQCIARTPLNSKPLEFLWYPVPFLKYKYLNFRIVNSVLKKFDQKFVLAFKIM